MGITMHLKNLTAFSLIAFAIPLLLSALPDELEIFPGGFATEAVVEVADRDARVDPSAGGQFAERVEKARAVGAPRARHGRRRAGRQQRVALNQSKDPGGKFVHGSPEI